MFAGDTLSAASEVIGVKENSNGKTGVVHVRTTGTNQHGVSVLSYVRWVMVNKRSAGSPPPAAVAPKLSEAVAPGDLVTPPGLDFSNYDWTLAGAPHGFEDYEVGEEIDHVDGMTIEEAEHQIATRLYQNTAKVHSISTNRGRGRFGKRLIYGGVAISTARALAFNGLANAGMMLAINAGRHVSRFRRRYRLRLVRGAGEDRPQQRRRCAASAAGGGKKHAVLRISAQGRQRRYDPAVILDFDYWAPFR